MTDDAPDPKRPQADDPDAGSTPPGATDPTGGELAALRQERDALQDQLKRTLADLANVRRRHAKEMEQVRDAAVDALARELLPVLDNFHLALEAHEQQRTTDVHSMIEGLRMVRSLLEAALERHGVREIEGRGHPFDPTRHDAVGLHEDTSVAPGHIAKVLQRGYYLADKVLRPSRVLVRDQRAAEEGTGPDDPASPSDS